jgi:hypothetical protein
MGGGSAYFPAATTPIMSELMTNGSSSLFMQDVIMTSSSQNWMSMIAGSSPDQHGVFDNSWEVGDSVPTPTIFAVLRAQRPNATIGVFHEWTGFGRLVEAGVPDLIQSPGDEDETTQAAIRFLLDGTFPPPDLLFVHLDHVDAAGHSRTWGSPAYYAAINKADKLIGEIMAALDQAGILSDSAVFISADHGGQLFLHDPDVPLCRNVPFIAYGQGIRRQAVISRELRIFDIAATLAVSMGLEMPSSWIARPIYEIFDSYVPPHAPSQKLSIRMVTDYEWIYDTIGTFFLSSSSFHYCLAPQLFCN